MKKLKENKGITLVALIITIIVLLILAVVAISAVNGDGIISKAKLARKNYQEAQETENAALEGYLTQIQENAGNGGNSQQQSQNLTDDLSKTKSYVGYYADLDNDGTPDGVIFVDLMRTTTVGIGKNDNEPTVSGTWNSHSSSTYSYTTITESKAYSIGDNHPGSFGTHPIISVKTGSTGNDRFYVMALNDIDSNCYFWNENYTESAQNNYSIGEYIESTTTTQVAMQTSDGESIGKRNTEILMSSTDLTGNTKNLWSKISTQVSKGWFVPSRAEWSAFGNYMWTNLNLEFDGGAYNYSSFGFGNTYWSSSQISTGDVWSAYFGLGLVTNENVHYCSGVSVRLATTF